MSEELKRTQLYQWHVDHGARMVPFAGWEMPVQYPTGPIEEHHATRRSAGLFDIAHMGQIFVSGPDAAAYLSDLATWDVYQIGLNESHYSLLCNESGGVVDDIFLYHLRDRWLVVINASNQAKDYEWLRQHIGNYNVTVTDVSDKTYMLALQGPRAIELLDLLIPLTAADIPRFSAAETQIDGVDVILGRTGYTGEDGVELFFPAVNALQVWENILNTGQKNGIEVKPIGLAARDSLRFEPAFPLYGHELADDITPLEANLAWACRFDTNFIGKEALLKQKETGLPKKLVGFELTEKGVPRQGYPITNTEGQEIGAVATGLYAPTINKYCGNAFVASEYAKAGTEIQVLIRDKPKAAVVVKRPLYTPAYKK